MSGYGFANWHPFPAYDTEYASRAVLRKDILDGICSPERICEAFDPPPPPYRCSGVKKEQISFFTAVGAAIGTGSTVYTVLLVVSAQVVKCVGRRARRRGGEVKSASNLSSQPPLMTLKLHSEL